MYDTYTRFDRIGHHIVQRMIKKIADLLCIIFFIIVLVVVASDSFQDDSWYGCAIDECPDSLKKLMPVEHYKNFEYGSKSYWHSFCTLLPDYCK